MTGQYSSGKKAISSRIDLDADGIARFDGGAGGQDL